MQRVQSTTDGRQIPNWTNQMIWVGAGLFVIALYVSAVFDPTIRLLHALQSLIYVAVIMLVRGNSPWGYGAGCFISGFWNSMNVCPKLGTHTLLVPRNATISASVQLSCTIWVDGRRLLGST